MSSTHIKVPLEEAPTLFPTSAEFLNPLKYFSSQEVVTLGEQYGILKVVPPADFEPPLSLNTKKFHFVPRLQKVKELGLLGRCRLFFFKQLVNFCKWKGELLPQGASQKVTGHKEIFFYDFFISVIKFYTKGKPSSTVPDISRGRIGVDSSLWIHLSGEYGVSKKALEAFYYKTLAGYFDFLASKPFSMTKNTSTGSNAIQHAHSILDSSDSESDSDAENDGENQDLDPASDPESQSCFICARTDDPETMLLCDSCDLGYHMSCLTPKLTSIPKGDWFCDACLLGTGQYGFKDSSYKYSLKEFEKKCTDFDERFFQGEKPDISELEEIFWSLVNGRGGQSGTGKDVSILYGADIHNISRGQVTGFPNPQYIPSSISSPEAGTTPPITRKEYRQYAQHPMNLNNLPFAAGSILGYLNGDISGMTIPWLYVGSTFSTFCWHVEDQWTLSANYQHLGAVKKWYGIPASSASRFEKVLEDMAPDLFAKQPDILHQLVTLVSPYELKEKDVKCYTVEQNPGEFVITFPRVYHSGFNTGYNFNEAVNFTMPMWLKYGAESELEYRKQGKAAVFDTWDLIADILNRYMKQQSTESDGIDLDMAKECLELIKGKLAIEYQLFDVVTRSANTVVRAEVEQIPASFNGEVVKYDKSKEGGVTCSKCKGFCPFFYVKNYTNVDLSKAHLPTPQASPASPDEGRKSKRLKLMDTAHSRVVCGECYLKVEWQDGMDEVVVTRGLDSTKETAKRVEMKIAG